MRRGWRESMTSTPSDCWFYIAGERSIGPLSAESLRSRFRRSGAPGDHGPQRRLAPLVPGSRSARIVSRPAGSAPPAIRPVGFRGDKTHNTVPYPASSSGAEARRGIQHAASRGIQHASASPSASSAAAHRRVQHAAASLGTGASRGLDLPGGRGSSTDAVAQNQEEQESTGSRPSRASGSAGGLRRAAGRETEYGVAFAGSREASRGACPEKVRSGPVAGKVQRTGGGRCRPGCAGIGAGRDDPSGSQLGDVRDPCTADSPGPDRRVGLREVETVGDRAGQSLLRRGLPAARLSGRHWHAADGPRGASVPERQEPGQAREAHRRFVAAARVRRLLGDEVERPAAGEGGVSHQSLAERCAGLSSLDPQLDQGQSAVRQVRARAAHLQRQQLPRAAGELLPRLAEQGSPGDRPGGGPDVHGVPGGEVAGGAAGGHVGVLFQGRLQTDRRVEGRDRHFRSATRPTAPPAHAAARRPKTRQTDGREEGGPEEGRSPLRRPSPYCPTGPPWKSPGTRTRARSLPTG